MPSRARCPYCDRLFRRDRLDDHVRVCRTKHTNQRKTPPVHVRRTLIIDGNNVAYHLAPDRVPRARNLTIALNSLLSAGFKPFIVVSAALKHRVNDIGVLFDLMDDGWVMEAPRGRNDDLTVIMVARQRDADIVSNDRFLDWIDRFPWLPARLRKYRMTPSGLILQ